MLDDTNGQTPHKRIKQMCEAGYGLEDIAAQFSAGSVVDSLYFCGYKAIKVGSAVFELPGAKTS